MTEAEAKTKWCPYANSRMVRLDRAPVQGPAIHQYVQRDGGFTLSCLGSDCMAWRWFFPGDPATDKAPGYCGLAGQP